MHLPQPYTRDLSSRDNALNLLRLALAFLVMFSHAQILAGVGDGVVWQGQHLGSWAVVGFFGISGFLITGARTRSNGAQYLMNRITRIYPGFLLSLVAVAFIFAPIAYYVERHSFDGLFGTPTTPLHYIYSNIFLLINHYDVSGTLASVPYPSAWNGSLWSLYYEFWCYIIIGVFLSWTFTKNHVWPTILLFLVSVAIHAKIGWFLPYVGNSGDFQLLIFMLPYFLGGAIIFQLRDRLPMRWEYAFVSLILALVCIYGSDGFGKQAASPFMAYLILWLGAVLPSPKLIQVHDISYGVYIFHFPVLQLLILFGVHTMGFWFLLMVSTLITVILATASWLGVERATMRWVRGKSPWGELSLAAR